MSYDKVYYYRGDMYHGSFFIEILSTLNTLLLRLGLGMGYESRVSKLKVEGCAWKV
jgi:hypothetical protein